MYKTALTSEHFTIDKCLGHKVYNTYL